MATESRLNLGREIGRFVMSDAKGWRDRAEAVRTDAEQMRDPVARKTLLKIAEEYEKLAKRAARRRDANKSDA
jgi:hypothetical protein